MAGRGWDRTLLQVLKVAEGASVFQRICQAICFYVDVVELEPVQELDYLSHQVKTYHGGVDLESSN